MIDSYEPQTAPNADTWLSMDEGERYFLVREYVQAEEPGIEGESLHVALHVLVENQIAMGDETPIRAAHERLMREGLSRHEALHAIGSCFAEFIAGNRENLPSDLETQYFDRVKAMTAEKFFALGEEDPDDFVEIAGGFDEPPQSTDPDALVYVIELNIYEEDLRATDELGLTITDSDVKSALRRAINLQKRRPPKPPPKKAKPKERWIAELGQSLYQIGKDLAAKGVSREEFGHALLTVEESLKTRSRMGAQGRGYLDFLQRFLADGDVL